MSALKMGKNYQKVLRNIVKFWGPKWHVFVWRPVGNIIYSAAHVINLVIVHTVNPLGWWKDKLKCALTIIRNFHTHNICSLGALWC